MKSAAGDFTVGLLKIMIPNSKILENGAIELITRHFDALNNSDIETFKTTSYLIPANEGKPFLNWWDGMSGLKPYNIEIESVTSDNNISNNPIPHVTIWVMIRAQTCSGIFEDKFVVWYMIKSQEYKLGCRIHWWLE